ncbi:cytochrome-c oxidase, cbb3-type subunit I [Candidatus Karelsulcia muelleri]|uniref:cytochrome-c oxidase n=1 Tax=Candidatus Karelsulcia muelleri TaxID=336810 RepID=A0A3A1MLU5_9FLAO|nr:cytochrome-c oxidase, cbb3-type subunit I [Candidatus Karelsulcia muelleri]RIU86178.1 cytochrome-c oxidase, cbb3-type subunit I [Candidatus Karelsulcia muelleri]
MANIEKFYYDNKIVKAFLYATIFWAFTGFFIGVIISLMLFYPDIPEIIFGHSLNNYNGIMGYGRLRMIHTTTVIFAFVGNIIFTGSYYSLQRLLKSRMYSDILSWINFWGWQIFIILSWITFLLGINTSKEYAEHEWPLDIIICIVWIIYGINIIGTILKRRIKHIYVSIWFFIGTWVSVCILHIFNNIELPIYLFSFKSYSIYAGVQDALVQWWYGHNAVAFILTTPILGLMYYFVPKASGKPIYSYKLSIIHFWSLIFIYIWAGPHHLIYTALPAWAQMLGTIFSIMLIAPSWGGMLNGLLTLRGIWNKVRKNHILKFFVLSITCYGMATFEGPMLATKKLNSIAHFTDWIVAHVHIGTLGWNGFMAFGVIYWLVEKLWNTKIYSKLYANIHLFLGTLGIIIYVIPMYWSAIVQSKMWKGFNPDGTLINKNFLDSVISIIPFYKIRFIGGILYMLGMIYMIYNIYKTIKKGSFINDEVSKTITENSKIEYEVENEEVNFHSWLERKPIIFIILTVIVVSIGGLVEIIPTMVIKSNIPTISSVKPYTPLELEGRDIYIREGCNGCHSQMVRPFRDEVVRYREYSKAGEFVYDHPFLWGSKRTGPDLAREGGKNTNSWHLQHMYDPRYTSPGSIMPRYPWLIYRKLDISNTSLKMYSMKKLGVTYSKRDIENTYNYLDRQAVFLEQQIYKESPEIKKQIEFQKKYYGNKFIPLKDREIIALISYLQRLGTDIKGNN